LQAASARSSTDGFAHCIEPLDKSIQQIEARLKAGDLSKSARDARMEELNNLKSELVKLMEKIEKLQKLEPSPIQIEEE
jgi:Mg2+ and Co2+ transporter CorA